MSFDQPDGFTMTIEELEDRARRSDEIAVGQPDDIAVTLPGYIAVERRLMLQILERLRRAERRE